MATIVEYVVTLEDAQYVLVEGSEEAGRLLQDRLAGSDSIPARMMLRESGDTEGHAVSGSSVAIRVQLGDDVEAHAFSLRFPTAEAARNFEKRLLTAGVLVTVVAAGAVGVGVGQALQQPASQANAVPIVEPAPAPAAAGVPTRDMDKDLAPIERQVGGSRLIRE